MFTRVRTKKVRVVGTIKVQELSGCVGSREGKGAGGLGIQMEGATVVLAGHWDPHLSLYRLVSEH